MKKKDEEQALFWCSLLHSIIFEEIESGEICTHLKKLSEKKFRFPDGSLKCPAFSTLRRKLDQYNENGFESLARKIRCDRGVPRKHSKEIIKRAIKLKEDQPKRSEETINQFLKKEYSKIIPKSSLYRYFRKAGATCLKLGVSKEKVRKRWTKEHTHDLWVGDFENGPYVLYQDQVVETHLCGWIDCASRYIPEARYYVRENLDILIDSLLRAFSTHGKPSVLYVDNAKVYHAKALKSACYAMHINLPHRIPRDPAGGGIIEKFFQTVQTQFEAEVRAGDILDLDQLNRAFSAWLEVSYHKREHSEIKMSPEKKYEQALKVIRYVDMEKAARFFMKQEIRTVHKDFSDVQLGNRFYKVDKRFRGDKILVRFDPYSTMDEIFIYTQEEEYLGKGTRHQREEGDSAGPTHKQGKPQFNYLDLLIQKHEMELQEKAKGIDYRKIHNQRRWSFISFASALARLMGKKGDISAFSTNDLEFLTNFYNRTTTLTESFLEDAVAQAEDKSLVGIIYQLQELLSRKEN